MRVLTITKRWSSGKDLVVERFGRYFHLPVGVAKHAAASMVIAADYRTRTREEIAIGGCVFQSLPLNGPSLGTYRRTVLSLAREFQPDVIFAGGDTHFGWVGKQAARRLGVPWVFDVFDNYAAFASGRVPGMKHYFRSLARSASLTVVVSEGLQTLLEDSGDVVVIPNGVDFDLFKPAQRGFDRQRRADPIIVYVGALADDRGTQTLIDAVDLIRSDHPGAELLLVGPIQGRFAVPPRSWIKHRGFVPQSEVPRLLASADVAVLPYPDTDWARFTSAYKLREYLACEIPVVVTDVSSYRQEAAHPEAVCDPGDARDMARAIDFQLENRRVVRVQESWSWRSRAADLYRELESLMVGGQPPDHVGL